MAKKHTKKSVRPKRRCRPPIKPSVSIDDLFALIRIIENQGEAGNRRGGIPSQLLADLIRFQFFTACRPSEALVARPCDFKPSGDILFYEPPLKNQKLHKRRIIYVGGLAKQLVESLCEKRQKNEYLFSHPDQPTVPLTPAKYLKLLHLFCKASGIERCSPTSLRHLAGTFLYYEYGAKVAWEILGISDPKVAFSTVYGSKPTMNVVTEWNQKVMMSIPSFEASHEATDYRKTHDCVPTEGEIAIGPREYSHEKAVEIRSALAQCTGSTRYFAHTIGHKLTEGAKIMADLCQAYWLFDLIISHQLSEHVRQEELQVWQLQPYKASQGALVLCDDGNKNLLMSQHVPQTDFPLPEGIKLYVQDKVIYLPSER